MSETAFLERLQQQVADREPVDWHAIQLGPPHVLPPDELDRVRAQFAGYGQPRRGPRSR